MSDEIAVKMTTMNYDKDRPAAENPVKIEDLSLRDGHQSLFAIPILPPMKLFYNSDSTAKNPNNKRNTQDVV